VPLVSAMTKRMAAVRREAEELLRAASVLSSHERVREYLFWFGGGWPVGSKQWLDAEQYIIFERWWRNAAGTGGLQAFLDLSLLERLQLRGALIRLEQAELPQEEWISHAQREHRRHLVRQMVADGMARAHDHIATSSGLLRHTREYAAVRGRVEESLMTGQLAPSWVWVDAEWLSGLADMPRLRAWNGERYTF
jgi:hypothetical protein